MKTEFVPIDRKVVYDSDGFTTYYTWYVEISSEEGYIIRNVFVFGDPDIYRPEDENWDYDCEDDMEAGQWFDDYRGFEDEEDLYD